MAPVGVDLADGCQHDRWSDVGGVSQGGDREELCR